MTDTSNTEPGDTDAVDTDAAIEADIETVQKRKRPSLFQVIQIVFAIAVVIVIVIFLATQKWANLKDLQLAWLPFTVSIVIGLIYRYWGTLIWLFLLERLGGSSIRHNFVELSYVYAKAWLGRYLLGAGTWIVGKVYFASQYGISKNKLAVSGVLEAILQLLSSLIVGLGLLLFDPQLTDSANKAAQTGNFGTIQILSVIFLALFIIALIPPVFRFGIGLVYRIVRRKRIPPEDLPDGKTIVIGALLYIAATLITGTSYFFVAQAVYAPLEWTTLLYIIGTSSIAAAASLIVVFAPGGLGVREGVQTAFFTAIMPVAVAGIVAIVMRVWSLAIDVLFFGVAWLVKTIATRAAASASARTTNGTIEG